MATNKPKSKPSGTDSVSKKQSFQEWAAAGGGVPLQYKGREHVWDRKVKQYAAGGDVHMQAGGISRLLKGLKGTQEVLPATQREANLQKMLEGSAIKERLYHGTGADISEFRPSVIGAMGPGTYLTKNPKEASEYANVISHKRATNQPNVLPVHAQVKNPFEISRVNRSGSELFLRFDPSGKLTDDEVIELVKKAGYDAIHALEEGTINVLDPRKIKSAIGNRGTYDTTNPDLNKAAGGDVHMDKGGAAFGVFPQMKPRRANQDREASKNVPVDLARGFVSGVLGAPGDIESFVRLPYELITGKDSPTFLPTSEDIEKRLPFRSEAPVSRLASGAGQLAGGFYMGPGSPLRAVGALPGAIKHGAQEFAKASAAAAPRLTVYQGSPHKFPPTAKNPLGEFDSSKIGTGEGAQAYGHGHYTAESPDVAKMYQETLSDFDMLIDGQPFNPDIPSHRAALELKQRGGELAREETIYKYKEQIEDLKNRGQKWADDLAKAKEEELKVFESKNVPEYSEKTKGYLYTIDLPDEKIARMLDWDKRLNEQYAIAERMKAALTGPDSPLSPAKKFEIKDYLTDPVRMENLTPQRIVDLNDPQIVEQLRKSGIPGIRYLDQGSRTAGKGTSNFVVFPGEEDALTILDRKKAGGEVKMSGGGKMGVGKEAVEGLVSGIKRMLKPKAAGDAPKGVEPIVVKEKPAKEAKPVDYSPKVLESTAARFAEKIAAANPKLSAEEVSKKALTQATKKLEWERTQKPALEKRYGALTKSSYAESNPVKQQNTPEVVRERMRKANEFLDQPTEPWTPPKPELQAFDRSSIKDALEGFPGVEQSRFPRDKPSRANIEHVEELYSDPANRALIEKQIKRGLPLGGETFYASLYPVKQAVLEAGMPPSKFDQWIHSLAPASARNSIMNEMAVGQFMRDMNARGIPLTEENVAREMALYKEKFGIGLPLMPIHRQGVANVLEGGQNLRDMNLANIPTNYKIPTYGTQKAGDFANSVVLDVHEAGGHTQGSRFHPYFNEQGGFGNTEYGAGEQGLLGIAKDLGIPGGMSQAGRWFGGGELTGLKSPRGDALDLLEKQVAYTLQQKGVQPNPANVRKEVLRQIETGEGDLLPWYRKEGMPDVRETGLQRAEGGEVHMAEGGKIGGLSTVNKLCGCHD